MSLVTGTVFCLVHWNCLLALFNLHKQAVDAVDNGISQYNTTQLPRFVNNTSLSSRVESLNPDWTVQNRTPAEEDESFQQAMRVAGDEFLEVLFLKFYNLWSLETFNDSIIDCWGLLAKYTNTSIHLSQCISFHAKSWLPARSVVMNCLLARKSIDSSGEIIMLTHSVPVSWKGFKLKVRQFVPHFLLQVRPLFSPLPELVLVGKFFSDMGG